MNRTSILTFISIVVVLSLAMPAHGQHLAETYPRPLLDSVLVAPGKFSPVPRAGDAYWRSSLPQAMRESYIRSTEPYAGCAWASLSATLFSEFKTSGNRVRYEAAVFEKRRQLATLAMAELAEGDGRHLDDIIDGLWNLCEETWWGIPAHYGHPYPIVNDQTVDLFNAETASLAAWTAYLFGESLDARSPLLRRRVEQEVERRLLRPALSTDYWWKRAGMNWNPWICSNWLACVLLCEHDRSRQLDAVGQILQCLDAFVTAYPDDGGCDEGPGYWDRAAASLFETLHLLSDATCGTIDLRSNAKLRAMGSYVYKTYIGGGYSICFADCHDSRAMQQVNILYPFGRYIDDPLMRGLARSLWAGDSMAGETYQKSGNFPTLGREVYFLKDIETFESDTSAEPRLGEVWLPRLQVMASRGKHLYVAMKGGHNDESHNHNDVGSFIVYADDAPLLIDPGVGEYTSQTFGSGRYDIWTMQSGYHNTPQINGYDQLPGKEHRASDADYRRGCLSMDIASAYPPEACVERWQRTVSRRGDAVVVCEDYRLKACVAENRLMLMTVHRPILAEGRVSIGSHAIHYDKKQLSARYEDLSERLDPILRKMWGDTLYRIVLTVKDTKKEGKVQYTIR